MKTIRIAAIMVLLASPVHAQSLRSNMVPDAPSKTPDQIEREQALERDYKEGLKKIPDAKASTDPWGNVRSVEPSTRTSNAATTTTRVKTATTKSATKSAAAGSSTAVVPAASGQPRPQ